MLRILKKIPIKTAEVVGVCFYVSAVLTHLLVLTGIIPFTWVNGGRTVSFAAQIPMSIISIIILIIGGIAALIAGGSIRLKYKRVITITCWFFTAFWTIGFIQQLLGTPFEKYVLSWMLILGIITNLRMAIENKTNPL